MERGSSVPRWRKSTSNPLVFPLSLTLPFLLPFSFSCTRSLAFLYIDRRTAELSPYPLFRILKGKFPFVRVAPLLPFPPVSRLGISDFFGLFYVSARATARTENNPKRFATGSRAPFCQNTRMPAPRWNFLFLCQLPTSIRPHHSHDVERIYWQELEMSGHEIALEFFSRRSSA